MRATNSTTESSEKALSRLSIGRAWATLASAVVGAAPSRCEGESARTSVGNCFSSAAFSRTSASYSESLISGSSWSCYSRSWRAIASASHASRSAASASVSPAAISAEQFLEEADQRGPRPLGGELVVEDAGDGAGRARVGEAVLDVAIGVNLPVGARLRQLLAKRDDGFRRGHRVVPAVEHEHLGLDRLRRQSGRVEQAVKAGGPGDVGAAAGEVQRALAAEAIADGDDPVGFDGLLPARAFEHREQPLAKARAVAAQPLQLVHHDVARGTAEFLAKQVGDKAGVAQMDQLAGEA